MEQFFKFLDDLLKSHNPVAVGVFCVAVVAGVAVVVLVVIAAIRKEQLNETFHLGRLWVHFYGGKDDPSEKRGAYRKLLYVQVNLLGDRATMTAPFYKRRVGRLREDEQIVPVYDEAVYYTLSLYPKSRAVGERESSGGAVDERIVIPWQAGSGEVVAEAMQVAQIAEMRASETSDTMLSVSHFLNGLQGAEQSISTRAEEDAETLRLVVDFSSVPEAERRVQRKKVEVLVDGRALATDDLHTEDCAGPVFMAHLKNAKAGTVLKMWFAFAA